MGNKFENNGVSVAISNDLSGYKIDIWTERNTFYQLHVGSLGEAANMAKCLSRCVLEQALDERVDDVEGYGIEAE